MDDRGKPAQEPPTLNATRQMLDELDALMERMLAVPVSEGEEATAAASPPLKSRPLAPTLTLLQVPPDESTSDEAPPSFRPAAERHAELPPLDPPHRGPNPSHLPILAARGNEADESSDADAVPPSILASFSYRTPELPPLPGPAAQAAETFSTRALPSLSSPSVDALLDEVPEPILTPVDWLLLPVIWVNRLFDRGTMVLGESGGWLRTSLGRMVLGGLGLVLLAAATLWLGRDWLGWKW